MVTILRKEGYSYFEGKYQSDKMGKRKGYVGLRRKYISGCKRPSPIELSQRGKLIDRIDSPSLSEWNKCQLALHVCIVQLHYRVLFLLSSWPC